MVKQKSNNNKNIDAVTNKLEFKGNAKFFVLFHGILSTFNLKLKIIREMYVTVKIRSVPFNKYVLITKKV